MSRRLGRAGRGPAWPGDKTDAINQPTGNNRPRSRETDAVRGTRCRIGKKDAQMLDIIALLLIYATPVSPWRVRGMHRRWWCL
jgi:hypothetical protein